MRGARLAAIVLVVVAGAGVAAIIAPREARAARSCEYFDFDKGTNVNSTLTLSWYDTLGRCLYSSSWRAGSGLPPSGTDACEINVGWLPNGWYDSPSGMTDHYEGSLIHGRVWRLQDKACSGGTVRTELFIHTEETVPNNQDCGPLLPNDDLPECWDMRAVSGGTVASWDYRSEGCIKVRRDSPEGSWTGDMGPVHSTYHDHIAVGHNNPRTDLVYVRS